MMSVSTGALALKAVLTNLIGGGHFYLASFASSFLEVAGTRTKNNLCYQINLVNVWVSKVG